jgi:4-diphosphocytidyl-2-C-methyl-D-erythritol kinase
MRVRAFAKINLSLRVLGRRRDGFHELRTIFQSIALHDTLSICAARGPFHVTCDDPECPEDEANLIWRAAERVWGAAGRRGTPRGVSVDLTKRIPMQAGLGGGSSDAAAALRAFARLWRVDTARVSAIAVELGADVPYFFEGGTVLGLERGDLLFPLVDPPPSWVVLALPDFGVSTKEAFAWWDRDRSPERVALQRRRRGARVFDAPGGARAFQASEALVNDLEAPVAARHPQIRRIVNALRRAGATHAAMTGSGSTVFGLFDSRTAAARAARAVGSSSRETLVTRTLNRSTYQRLAAV